MFEELFIYLCSFIVGASIAVIIYEWRHGDSEDESVESPKPLLILDLNKVLAFRGFIYNDKMVLSREQRVEATVVGNHYAWKRPHLDSFLDHVFENYTVAVWSSANRKNVELLCDFIFGTYRDQLLFVWCQDECEKITPHPDPEESSPALYRKDLVRVWNTFQEFHETNTIIVDDCPFKMAENPPLNVIFPRPWSYLADGCQSDVELSFHLVTDLDCRFQMLSLK